MQTRSSACDVLLYLQNQQSDYRVDGDHSDGNAKRTNERKPFLSVDVNAENIYPEANAENSSKSFQFGDTTYRHDGLSIGRDYLRCDGRTLRNRWLVSNSLTVGALIGEGNFSKVHKGFYEPNLGVGFDSSEIPTIVAVKKYNVLDISEYRRKMMIVELRALSRLESEALVAFHGAFLEEDVLVLVMEYMDGGSLETWRKTNKNTMNPEFRVKKEPFFASIAYQVLIGLDFLHSQVILHRDIKPGNILLDKNGAVKLCDFGICSLNGERDNSLQTTVVGTSRFMAPERLRGKPYGRASDIWSFGLVLLELWRDEIPFKDCESIISLIVTIEETPVEDLISGIDCMSNLRDVLLGCLHQVPEKRMPSSILRMAPWFTVQHQITSLDLARKTLLENKC